MCILEEEEINEIIDILDGKDSQSKSFSDQELKCLQIKLHDSFTQELTDLLCKYDLKISEFVQLIFNEELGQ